MKALAAGAMLAMAWPATASEPLIRPAEWQAWREAFVAIDGRVVDTGNGGVSHSEGQGYGMLLAVLADQPGDFAAIWGFTRAELLIRDDGLAAWRWEPGATPPVTDLNAASDGDILIAYALDLAADAWGDPGHAEAAQDLATAIGNGLVADDGGRPILLPGPEGFSAADRPDGPVVNLSYWVFEAFPTLARLDPGADWPRIGAEGLRLVEETRLGARGLPPDWLSLPRGRPAEGFPPEYGYNALRLPLYLVRAGLGSRALLDRLRAPPIVDLAGGEDTVLEDAGYRAIPAIVACKLDGTPLPAELASFAPTDYYPSTLHLLVLAEARREMPQCL